MPDVDPVTYEAIDHVIENRDPQAEWAPEEMRKALKEHAKGTSQSQAVGDRDFSQALLSKRWADVEEVADELRQQYEADTALFKDPIQQAADQFREFFEELDEEYGFGINDLAVRMMVDEIEEAGQLPAPMYVKQFLDSAKSGVGNAQTLNYITRRYSTWLENYQQDSMSDPGMDPGQGFSGPSIQQTQPPQQGMAGGPQVGTEADMFPNQQQEQSQPPRRHPPEPQQQHDPRIDQLQEQVEQLTEVVAQQAQGDDGETEYIRVEQDDGTVIELPVDDPRAKQMFEDDEEDMFEQMRKLCELGLIVTPTDLEDDSGDAMGEAVAEAIESLGQRQMQMQQQQAERFESVLEQIRESEEDDEPDLSGEDVRDIINDELKEDEVDRLERELQRTRESMEEELKSVKRAGGVEQNPEFAKRDREIEFQEESLRTLNENLQVLPEKVSAALRDGIVPAMKEVQHMQPGEGHPAWSPPAQQQQGEPAYVPEEAQQPDPQPQPQPRQQQPTTEESYPDPEVPPQGREPERQTAHEQTDQAEPEQSNEQKAAEVRERLGLTDSDTPQEVEA